MHAIFFSFQVLSVEYLRKTFNFEKLPQFYIPSKYLREKNLAFQEHALIVESENMICRYQNSK